MTSISEIIYFSMYFSVPLNLITLEYESSLSMIAVADPEFTRQKKHQPQRWGRQVLILAFSPIIA